jgi:uncharacterized protein with NAD-binding domain and iron-sulfur cluster
MKKVIILGGGVAGMSAAHELGERGFEVEVFERNPTYCGGKARSVDVPDTNLQYKDKFLPGEHGFRFFPGFYKHVTDTMKRIPYKDANGKSNEKGCFGNLTPTSRIMIARNGKDPIVTDAGFPRSLSDLKTIVHDMTGGVDSGLTREEIHFFAERTWQLMTSCKERRNNDYERIGWWEYLQADRFSETYQHLLVEGLTRTLVAAQAKSASTKTGGDIFLQLIFNMLDPGIDTDRVLNGPTNEKWLHPWVEYLTKIGVKYHFGHEVASMNMIGREVKSVVVKNEDGKVEEHHADYFILATPVEKAAEIINDDMIKIDSTLKNVESLAKSVSWMNGIQYYLNEDVSINKGHIIFSDSEWAVTSISQVQFWKDYDLSSRYNGKVKGVLSVDISDWLVTKYKGKIAEDVEPDEVAKLVWEQMKSGLNIDGREILRDDMIEHYYLDRDIRWYEKEAHNIDEEPLLVNTINSWALRPEAATEISNFFLASDYVRTNTDLATMEGANEAARRAVNCIIDASGTKKPLCRVWGLKEPLFFQPLKWRDKKRYEKGLPYTIHLPLGLKIFMVPWGIFSIAFMFLQSMIFKIMK